MHDPLVPLSGFCRLIGASLVPRLWRICVVGVALDPATWMLIGCAVIYGVAPGIRWIVQRLRGDVPESPT